MGVNQRAQIKMSDEEINAFLHGRHSMSMATMGPDGRIQLVAMWYGFIEGDIGFETKAKSQKVLNLRRDNRLTVMVEDGETYDQLRGVELAGWGEIIEDPEQLLALGVSVWERYYGPFSDEQRPFVDAMLKKRVLIRLHTEKVVSWDHRKLGAAPAG
jgi:PPOX class probable F420-dependent enzyme